MSLASRAGDLYYSYRFVKLLTTPWEETDAFKLGLIDKEGKRVKSVKLDDADKKSAYTTFHRLAYNLKRLLNKVPGGKNTISSYAAALFLLREHFAISDKSMEKMLDVADLDPMDLLGEQTSWLILEDRQLAPGVYRLSTDSVTTDRVNEVNRGDKVRVLDGAYPIDDVFGVDIYEAIHLNTNQPMFIALGDIVR